MLVHTFASDDNHFRHLGPFLEELIYAFVHVLREESDDRFPRVVYYAFGGAYDRTSGTFANRLLYVFQFDACNNLVLKVSINTIASRVDSNLGFSL